MSRPHPRDSNPWRPPPLHQKNGGPESDSGQDRRGSDKTGRGADKSGGCYARKAEASSCYARKAEAKSGSASCQKRTQGVERDRRKREPKSVRRPELPLPAKIERKAEVVQVNDDPTYGEYLIAYLQNALDLPEYGEVKAQLEIDRFGRLVDCQIVYTKSGKNAEFLKNQLPELTFPCLNDFGILDSTHIFTITFRNAE